MNKLIYLLFILSILVIAPTAIFTQSIRAVYLNPPGADNGQEYFEISGTSGAALTDLYFIAIEGDGTGAGVIDLVINLSSFSLGSNGLLLWRDAASVISPAPSPETTLAIGDFNPDIENGSNTFLLISAASAPTVGTDVDSDNDGIINVSGLPWTSVLSAVALVENDGAANYSYADDFGGFTYGPDANFNADFLGFDGTQWVAGDVMGTNPGGPYTIDPARNNISPSYNATLTPGNTASALPILLDHLKSTLADKQIILDWITGSERNNDYFSIERSTDGNNFREISKVKGAGEANTPTSYSFTDENPVKGTNYYRLRQVDFDGQFTFSKVVSAQFGKTGGITVIPTTAVASVQVQLEESFSSDASWQVLDITGRIVQEGKLDAEQTHFDIQTSNLSTGGYVLRVIAGQEIITGRFRKQ